MGRTLASGPFPSEFPRVKLEGNFKSQLDRAGPTGTHGGIGSRYVWRSASATKVWSAGIVQPEAVLSAIRIGKVWMIENVEELGAELSMQPLAKVPVLGHREVQVPEA